jgi:hypothetical protein
MIQGTAAWEVVRALRADAIAADGSIRDKAPA